MRRLLPPAFATLVIVAVVASSSPAAEQPSTRPSIRGHVTFAGPTTQPRIIRVEGDPNAVAYYANRPAPLAETWVIDKDGNLANAFVYVSKGLEGKTFTAPVKAQPAMLDQVGFIYTPHVQGILVGQPLKIHNSDAALHNVHLYCEEQKPFSEGMPVKDMVITKVFDKPEVGMAMKCDVHTWMVAYVHVMEHPFFAVSDAKGRFEIAGLPAGEYELTVWHEFNKFKAKEATIKVTVPASGEPAEVEFVFSAKARANP